MSPIVKRWLRISDAVGLVVLALLLTGALTITTPPHVGYGTSVALFNAIGYTFGGDYAGWFNTFSTPEMW